MPTRRGGVIELVGAEYAERRRRRSASACAELFDLLDQVKDPEVPALSLWELGVLQDIQRVDKRITVTLTPTYSGCPAIDMMAQEVTSVLMQAGLPDVVIETRLAPAWTTDWMSAAARRHLFEYGIAPPGELRCPQCGSSDYELVSEFGSTACKALYRCLSCREPFDYFKPI